MLTDLHVHLRPDDEGTDAARYFTAANAARYREAASERGIEELGVSEHIHRFRDALSIWQHPFWQRNAHDDLEAYCQFVREETDLLLGIEADWIPGAEDRTANLLDSHDFDYVVGSVHFLRDHAVDLDEFDVWSSGDAHEVWTRYFDALAHAASSGLFDVLAHPDLVKVWGDRRPQPTGDLRRYYEPAIEAIHEAGVAVEVSTAGLRKPAGEIYPAPAFLEMALEAGAAIVLSSDAHVPEHLGYEYPRAQEMMRAMGVTEIATFRRRERRMVELG